MTNSMLLMLRVGEGGCDCISMKQDTTSPAVAPLECGVRIRGSSRGTEEGEFEQSLHHEACLYLSCTKASILFTPQSLSFPPRGQLSPFSSTHPSPFSLPLPLLQFLLIPIHPPPLTSINNESTRWSTTISICH